MAFLLSKYDLQFHILFISRFSTLYANFNIPRYCKSIDLSSFCLFLVIKVQSFELILGSLNCKSMQLQDYSFILSVLKTFCQYLSWNSCLLEKLLLFQSPGKVILTLAPRASYGLDHWIWYSTFCSENSSWSSFFFIIIYWFQRTYDLLSTSFHTNKNSLPDTVQIISRLLYFHFVIVCALWSD